MVSINHMIHKKRRMGDSNSRAELPRPDGFQDRSLQPDLGNPPCLSNDNIKFIKSDSVCQ